MIIKESAENYLEAILMIQRKKGYVRSIDIANELHISEKYMYRLFMNRFNLSPQQFLLKTRMEVAKNLLEENNMSVKEIAFTVGYSSIQTFSKAFTNYYGVCPSLLKKQNCILK